MKSYKVEIKEVVRHIIEVEAENEDEACNLAREELIDDSSANYGMYHICVDEIECEAEEI